MLPHFLLKTREELTPDVVAVRNRRHLTIGRELMDAGYRLFKITDDSIERVDSVEADSRRKFDYLASPAEFSL